MGRDGPVDGLDDADDAVQLSANKSVQPSPCLQWCALAGISIKAGDGFFLWWTMAKQPKGLPEEFFDLSFPNAGVDLKGEFEQQRDGTTALGRNVRSYAAIMQRGRGGSRPGLEQYVPQQVSGPNLIQHLNYIVDPTSAALLTNFDPLDTFAPSIGVGIGFQPFPGPGSGFVLDGAGFPIIVPSIQPVTPGGGFQMPNGFFTRTGGNGIQPNKSTGTLSTRMIQFRQVATADTVGPVASLTISLTNAVALGSTLLVCVLIGDQSFPASSADGTAIVTDSFGVSYQQVNNYVGPNIESGLSSNDYLSMWLGNSGAHAGANTITVTFGGHPSIIFFAGVVVLEYSSIRSPALLPIDGTASNISNDDASGIVTTNPVAIHAGNELLLAVFNSFLIVPDSGFTQRGVVGGSIGMQVFEKIGPPIGSLAVTGTMAPPPPSTNSYSALGASFKPA